ncbi:TonB family protein [Phormidium sp. LEGE 05292]|uniref:energy transducer TonB n=1 Tax=[Phormidium] sp. LEGE 05292 TaxID=767427 RepID=UPI0018827EF8|nr:energy transducer TonB [Phormidium sp. LEGE 05292]MBE9225064.1 TonB family protein [Phormidium sp. LEGE 05292]
MSISSFCLEQREKEKAAFKSILAYSIAGSTVLHIVLAFGFALLLPKEPSLAEDPIEVVVLDTPEPEVQKLEVKIPKPTPQPVVTPTPEKIIPTPTPEPIPTPTPEPIPTPKVELPKPLEKPVEPEEVKEAEPIKTPDIAEPEKVAETLPPPKISETVREDLQKPDPPLTKPKTETANTPQPLQTPLARARDFKDRLAQTQQPVEKESRTEETPQLPRGLNANQQPLVDNSRVTSQPLESSVAGNREFRDRANATLRDRIAANNNSTSGTTPGDDNSLMNPGIPGEVSTNRENITNKPTATSQPLLTSTNGDRKFRDSIANSNNSPPTTNPGSDISNGTPGIPGQVTANNQRPNNRPVGGNQPLQTATNNRGFRNSFSNNDSSNNFGSPSGTSNPQTSPTTPGTSTGVAVNQPPARSNRQEGDNSGGNRRTARRSGRGGGLRCVSQCNPDYPPDVENLEGRPVVQFVVEADGSTADPQVAESSGNSRLDRAAVEAVQKMRFAPPDEGRRTVKLAINFATSGSDFERQARQRREQNERQRRERESQRQENLGLEN